jgi:hypothetical protein
MPLRLCGDQFQGLWFSLSDFRYRCCGFVLYIGLGPEEKMEGTRGSREGRKQQAVWLSRPSLDLFFRVDAGVRRPLVVAIGVDGD